MTGLRVAVAGYGLAGRVFHAPLVAATPGLSLAFVVTGNDERGRQARSDHPGLTVVGSSEELLARADEWDVLVVATTNDAHVPLGLAGARLGKAVVVDKPLATTSEQARGLVTAAGEAGAVLTVFQYRRWDSDQPTSTGWSPRASSARSSARTSRASSGGGRSRGPARGARRCRPSRVAAAARPGAHLVDPGAAPFGRVRRV